MKINVPEKILKSIAAHKLFFDEPMSRHTAIGTGGKAALLIVPDTPSELCFLIDELRGMKNHVTIGNGSNTLVSDSGYSGIIIKTSEIKGIERYGKFMTVYAGETLKDISENAYNEGLKGMEWASADNGTFGGALCSAPAMFKGIVYAAEVISKSGELHVLREFCSIGGKSLITKNDYTLLRAILCLARGDKPFIERNMCECRKAVGMLDGKKVLGPVFSVSKGSVDARKYISDSGIASKKDRPAYVCEENPNYIINSGNATSADIYDLINEIVREVLDNRGVQLTHNVRLAGRF